MRAAKSSPRQDPSPLATYTDDERDDLKLWVVLARAHDAVASVTAADIRRHDLSVSEFAILELLYHKGATLLGDIRKRVLVSSGGTTFLTDRLVARGLVVRQDCPQDRRARYADLTAEGRALIADIFPAHIKALQAALAELNRRDKHLLTELLKRMGRYAASQTKGAGTGVPEVAAGRGAAPRAKRARRGRTKTAA